jgi:hypothetical protein
MLLQAIISVVTLTAIAGSAINLLAGGKDALRATCHSVTQAGRSTSPAIRRLCEPRKGQTGKRCSPRSCDYGPTKVVAASWRSEGYPEHSTGKSASANKTAIAEQITTLLARRSLVADSDAFIVESVVVT